MEHKTGYEISLREFIDLCVDDHENFAPLLREWFGYEIVVLNRAARGCERFEIRGSDGAVVDPEAVHSRIQSDPERQHVIYCCAMTHWH